MAEWKGYSALDQLGLFLAASKVSFARDWTNLAEKMGQVSAPLVVKALLVLAIFRLVATSRNCPAFQPTSSALLSAVCRP